MTAPDRRLLVGLLAVLVLVFALVASNVAANHAPKPHGVPVGLIGDTPAVGAVAGSLAHSAPGAYNVHRYATLAEARAAILDRSVYGAYSPAPSSRLLVASAASLSVASLLKQRFAGAGRVNGRSPVVQDVAPLPSSDPNGATAFSMLLSLILAGELGAVLIFTLGRHRSAVSRLVVIVGMGLGAGLTAALVTNVVVSAFHAFWRELSQLLPPGAAITAIRDVVYFHGQGIGRALLVLSLWIVAGTTVVVTLHVLRARPSSAPAPAQPVPA